MNLVHLKKKYLKFVYWANATFQLPYLISALYFLSLSFSNKSFQEYHGAPSFGFVSIYILFVIFHVIFIFLLIKLNKLAKWFVLIDAVFGFLLIFSFGIAGAYMLMGHPGQLVYQAIGKISEKFATNNLIWVFFSAKSIINTFNLVFFFGDPIFNLSQRYKVAHVIWLIPSLLLIGLPTKNAIEMNKFYKKHHSRQAEILAKNEFNKLTCEDIRKNNGKEAEFFIDDYKIEVSYDFDYTGVWVTGPDGKDGSDGGPKYFCRPEYSGERSK